jgi:hypothetical protein
MSLPKQNRPQGEPKLGSPPAAFVAKQVETKFSNRLHETAICLTTPIPKLVPLSSMKVQSALKDFLNKYEPRLAKSGLYEHQAKVIKALNGTKIPNVVMTTATGSGKSLAFMAWSFEVMRRDPNATVIATFPTQALLWGQAQRLANASVRDSLVVDRRIDGVFFAGTIQIDNVRIPWSVWYGETNNEEMKVHANSEAFKTARLRLSTLDKVHWSLMQKNQADYLSRLGGFIIDEAHWWHGLTGANVRAMVDRLRLGMDVLKSEKHPAFFLASATLADAASFAADLTGLPASSFLEVNDKGVAKASLVSSREVPELLTQPAEAGLLRRYVFLLKPEPEPIAASNILGDHRHLGDEANVLCFVQSKSVGHQLQLKLSRALRGRDVIAYDADLSAKDRRKVERELFKGDGKAKLVVGTNALELGVDLPTLDIVVMDELPSRRSELLQRLGRVGRTSERPGLAILCLGYSASDERLIEEPLAAFAVDNIKPLPLPLHLDVVRLRAMYAAFKEWLPRLKWKEASWDDFNPALKRYFGEALHWKELDERVKATLGDVIDLDSGSWWYEGFRVGASQGKRGMFLEDDLKNPVAVIDDIAIFRDAHPEGVYLGHRGSSYRVKGYVGRWDVGTWKSPGGWVLGKLMKGLDRILVSEERPTVRTRGAWQDLFTLDAPKDLPAGCEEPAKGQFTFGTFTFVRKFDGYYQIDLSGNTDPKRVPLSQVAKNFEIAKKDGTAYPFLHNFSYRTKGWKWLISRVLDKETRGALAGILGPLLEDVFCDAVECSRRDLQVTLDAQSAEIRVVDGTPGGNGLCEALLREGRIGAGFTTAIKQMNAYGRRPKKTFRRYLVEECQTDSDVTAEEISDAFQKLADAWNG